MVGWYLTCTAGECGLIITSGQSIWLDIRPHRRRRRTVQSYSSCAGNVPSHKGILAPPGEYYWKCASFRPPESTTQTANWSVQPFLQGRPTWTVQSYSPGGVNLIPCNTFLGPTGDLNPNGILIASAILQRSLLWQTDQQTDRPTDHAARSARVVCETYNMPRKRLGIVGLRVFQTIDKSNTTFCALSSGKLKGGILRRLIRMLHNTWERSEKILH